MPDGRDRHAADPGVLAIENSDSRESESHFYGGRRVHSDIFPRGTVIYRACPGWDSNPHLMVFETIPSTGWGTGAQTCRGGERHDDNVPADGRLVG